MRIMRLQEVMATTGLARSTVYKFIANEKFPKPVSLGGRSTGWVAEEVNDWVLERIEEHDANLGAL